jgi:hypothetical protein
MSWFLEHAAGLNFGVSLAHFLIGLVIGFRLKPDLVKKGRFGEWAFGLWTSQWLFFSVMYLVIVRYPTQEALLLSLIDLQSLAVLGCAAMLLLGEPVKLGRAFIILGVMFSLLAIYNFGLDPWNSAVPSPGNTLRWTLPSQTLSVFSLTFIATVMSLRYRWYGLVFLFVAVSYSACQQALYSATLVRFKDISQALPEAAHWFFAAAILKLLLGSIFYFLCFLEIETYPRLISPQPPTIPETISKNLNGAAAWLIGFLVVDLGVALLAAFLIELAKK